MSGIFCDLSSCSAQKTTGVPPISHIIGHELHQGFHLLVLDDRFLSYGLESQLAMTERFIAFTMPRLRPNGH